MAETLEGRSVTDVMLDKPKTVPPSASVTEVRELLANDSVQMVLIADGERFCGALTELPEDADGDQPAVAYADTHPASLPPTATAAEAFERTAAHPSRRIVVLEDDKLVGLVCLDHTRTRFCGRSSRA